MENPAQTQQPIVANDDIVFFAFRYCLGRTTFAPTQFVEWCLPQLNRLKEETLRDMLQEIEEAVAAKQAGHECDVEVWQKFATALRSILLLVQSYALLEMADKQVRKRGKL